MTKEKLLTYIYPIAQKLYEKGYTEVHLTRIEIIDLSVNNKSITITSVPFILLDIVKEFLVSEKYKNIKIFSDRNRTIGYFKFTY